MLGSDEGVGCEVSGVWCLRDLRGLGFSSSGLAGVRFRDSGVVAPESPCSCTAHHESNTP